MPETDGPCTVIQGWGSSRSLKTCWDIQCRSNSIWSLSKSGLLNTARAYRIVCWCRFSDCAVLADQRPSARRVSSFLYGTDAVSKQTFPGPKPRCSLYRYINGEATPTETCKPDRVRHQPISSRTEENRARWTDLAGHSLQATYASNTHLFLLSFPLLHSSCSCDIRQEPG